ncbi:Rab family GTPase [Marinomonas mediterranea]|jgi:small GTP-binding protein domain|uniref:Small GTP-binding protein n=1 Tax=Marinomonas mediterranea (strain ATCC 700492 / JCM 21426 / NBRC 103028 / MMB-1) TaxID=717774 RepID=F2JUS8_MARM1|nr:Rab family GTPase [Marinomonas mediterranea]ADZ90493.1 small GTP-binding protein [Marinomonas mediterranea MMB-1]WCN08546.1 GTP-binding protein [Marinomonas mediterranea]WCN12600.1 GTP-binding protein [Marinomonas mediterranea]WCN16672.1 GTP-binding protein [Marinomonas mediterranea MMB-1]
MIQKKICMLGASAVGKTSLVKQFVEGIFSDRYLTSIGVKIDKKILEVEDSTVQLMLWDIEGVDRYAGFNPKYLRGASAAIIVVDQTRTQSFLEGVEICRLVKLEKEMPIFLVSNKSDLPKSGTWDSAADCGVASLFERSFNTSAKTGDGVEDMFHNVAKAALNK